MRRTGEQLVMEGVRWIRSHPRDWQALQEACVLIEAATDARGRKKVGRITRDTVYQLALQADVEIRNDAEYRRDHDLWSTLARYLLHLHPQLARVIRVKRCAVGEWIVANGFPDLAA